LEVSFRQESEAILLGNTIVALGKTGVQGVFPRSVARVTELTVAQLDEFA